MSVITMPRLSDSMEEGSILEWLKADGVMVERGDDLVEIETDKAALVHQADQSGVLHIIAAVGDTLAVGEVIGELGGDGRLPNVEEASLESGEPSNLSEEPALVRGPSYLAAAPTTIQERQRISPIARRMALQGGVDLKGIKSSGPYGRIVKRDIQAALESGSSLSASEPAKAARSAKEVPTSHVPIKDAIHQSSIRTQSLTRTQQVIAERMAVSTTVPTFTVEIDVVLDGIIGLRKKLKTITDPPPSINDCLVKAVANTLRDFPKINGSYQENTWVFHEQINIGIAVAADDTLLVPVIPQADNKSLGAIAAESRMLASHARQGTVRPEDLQGGTFTISNLGTYGISRFSAIINSPQAAILAIGAGKEAPIAEQGQIQVRTVATLTLNSDHRILYGADAASFLAALKTQIESPHHLML